MTHIAGDIENPAKGTIVDINSAFIGENKTSLQIQFRLQESCDGNSLPIADAMRASHRPVLPLKGNRCQSGALMPTFPNTERYMIRQIIRRRPRTHTIVEIVGWTGHVEIPELQFRA